MADPSITGHVRLDVSGLVERLRFARAVTSRQISRLVRDANARLRGLDTSSLTTSLARVAGMIGSLGRLAVPFAVAGAAIGGLVPIVAGLTAALADILPASALAVSGVLAIGLAAGTLRIAMSGVGDAVKAALDPSDPAAYAEALKKLSPNARGFVEAIRRAQPALDAIKKSVQDRVFAGLGKQLAATGTVALPVLRRALGSTATTLNRMGKEALTAARTVARDGTLGTALTGATDGLRSFSRLPGQIVTGLTQIGAAAAPAFARLSKAGGSALDRLAAKMTKSFESGGMERAIEQAITLIGQLGRVIGNVGGIFGAVFGAAQQTGGGFLSVLESVTAEIARIAKTDAVQGGLKALFSVMSTVGKTVAPLLGQALQAIGPVLAALGPPIETLIKALGAGLSPIITALGPVLLAAAKALGTLITSAAPLLPILGQLVADLLPALTPLLDAAATVFAALAPVVQTVGETLRDTLAPVIAALPSIIKPLAGLIADQLVMGLQLLGDLLVTLGPSLVTLGTALGDLMVALAPLIAAWAELSTTLLTALMPALQPIIALVGKVAALLANDLSQIITDVVVPAVAAVAALLRGDFSAALYEGSRAASGFSSTLVRHLTELPSKAATALAGLVVVMRQKALEAGAQLLEAIARKRDEASRKIAELPGQARAALGNLGGVLVSAGASLISGLIAGIESKIGAVRSKLQQLTGMIPDWKGPKRKDATLLTPAGKLLIKGLIDGIDASTASLKSKLGQVTTTIERAITINRGNRKKVSGLDSLLKRVNSDNKRLLSMAKQRDAVASKLKTAQKKLDDAVKERSTAAAGFRDGILGDANITTGNNVVNSVSAITIGLQQAVAKAKLFGENLAKLKKAGLRSDLLGDIAAAGVDGGAATAEALARATPAELKRINDLQAQLAKAATSTGTSVAGALYDSGVKAAQGLVDGLKRQQGAIEKQMERIAAAMVKAMKKALKIKSPSRVFMGIGQMSGDGLREGMLRSRQAVAAASASMAAAAVGAADVAGRAMSAIPAPGQLTTAYAGTAGPSTTTNTFNLYQSEASPEGILRALSWRGLVGRR
ncbi:hypothetical protein ACFV97_02420 [Streptomyces sp. NPDC059913]|uniref:hypothetical protein n=1 Tax=unclassified Streptomyces TaxID=2593676 RepID=UPI00364A9E83